MRHGLQPHHFTPEQLLVARAAEAANRGRQTVMNSQPASGGGFAILPTTLIAENEPDPNEWIINVAPPVTTKQGPVIPYQQGVPIDATATAPTTSNTNIPALPGAGLQLLLRWATGGVELRTQFDYPVLGGVFGLSAERVNLDVVLKPWPLPVTYATQDVLPVVAAFMTPGRPATKSPLQWVDQTAGLAATGDSNYYIVKPFARKLQLIASGMTFVSGDSYIVEWGNIATGALYRDIVVPSVVPSGNSYFDVTFDVPAAAQYVRLVNEATNAVSIHPIWHIGLE